ncbi:hypothetical protein ABEB36_010003 [Hypothenemus hampei]|uniref:Uncharacterized protein n=1 Tax=Hypothenemus hampei TaxID=57062 RepID=A0ABD1EI72_HYPHA
MSSKNLFFLVFLCGIFGIYASLIDSLAYINSSNSTQLPEKKNFTSKYSCLLNHPRISLHTVLDVHKQKKYDLKSASKKKFNVNNIISEEALVAIGDSAMQDQLRQANRSTDCKTTTTNETD